MRIKVKDHEEMPQASISKDDVVRAARMFSPGFFGKLKGERRKVAVLTLKRGFLPVLRNCTTAADVVCKMCKESQGKDYNPLACTRKCAMLRACEQMERLHVTLQAALKLFIKDED